MSRYAFERRQSREDYAETKTAERTLGAIYLALVGIVIVICFVIRYL